MKLYQQLKLHLGLFLLKTHNISMIDIWYYSYKLHKECILTIVRQSDIERYLPLLTSMVKKKKAKISYIHFIKSLDIHDKI